MCLLGRASALKGAADAVKWARAAAEMLIKIHLEGDNATGRPTYPCTLEPALAALYCLKVDGVQLAGIPKHKLTGWASYQWVLDQGTLTAYGSWAYTGEYFTSTFARPWDEVPERHRLDARLSFDSADQRWSASLFVDNILDETYLRWSDMEPRRSGYGINYPQRVVALMPRYIGFEVVYNFL